MEWDAVVGRESWGAVVAIFVPKRGAESPRQTLLNVTSLEKGNRLLREMSEEELRNMLGVSIPKPTGEPFDTDFRGEG